MLPASDDRWCSELKAIAEETIALAGRCRLCRRHMEGRTGLQLMFARDADTMAAVERHRARLDRYVRASAAAVRRRGIDSTEFHELADELARLVSFEWVAEPAQPAPRVLRAFIERLRTVVHEVCSILESAVPLFETRKPRRYDELYVRVEIVSGESWRVVARSHAEIADRVIAAPFRNDELLALRSTLLHPKNATGGRMAEEALATLGARLFRHLFSGDHEALYRRSQLRAIESGHGLRICIDAEATSPLLFVPWELLRDGASFVALADVTSVVRTTDRPGLVATTSFVPPLRVLLTASSPSDLPALDVSKSIEIVQAAVAPLTMTGALELDVVSNGSPSALARMAERAARERRPYDIWHFAGHGRHADSALAFRREDGRAEWIESESLAGIIDAGDHPRLAIVNACHSGDGAAVPSVASALVRRGVPAAVGMQMEISYAAARTFDSELYAVITAGASIDEAVLAGRRAVLMQPNAVEWIRPILVVRRGGGASDVD